jgi:large subunit ribosomal protein L25
MGGILHILNNYLFNATNHRFVKSSPVKKLTHQNPSLGGIHYLCASFKNYSTMKSITIEGQLRTESGKKATRQLRSQDMVPGVIYGGKKEINFAAPAPAFKGIVYTPEFMVANVLVEGQSYRCILKDLQFDKVTDQLTHVDFLELVEDKKVIATLPLHYIGTPAGVKAGGKLVTKMKAIKVKTLPKYLKEHIDVDLSELELNGNLRVENIVAENMEILNSPRIPIASVTMTRQLKQEEAAAATAPKAAASAPKAAAPAAAPKK